MLTMALASPNVIHFFVTDKCNLDCAYCFRAYSPGEKSSENTLKIAEILAQNKVKHVIIGGGEPTLVKNLDEIIGILKNGNVSTELHTNCLTLTRKRLEELRSLVDVIGIPIDTLDEKIQTELRTYPNYVKLIKRVTKDCQDLDYKIVFHTVATDLNINQMPALYSRFIKNTNCDLWKIYEFNDSLAMLGNVHNRASRSEKIKRYEKILQMCGPYDPEKGDFDCLLAKFLLTEEKMKKKYEDKRIKFVGVQDEKPEGYLFIDDTGIASYYNWFLTQRQTRFKIGNLLAEGFPAIIEKYQKAEDEEREFSEDDFIKVENSRPLFVRLCENCYAPEEIDDIKPKYWRRINHLMELWQIKHHGEALYKLMR